MVYERKKIGYRYFYVGCIIVMFFILLLTFNYVGIYYMTRIIFGLIIIIFSSWIIKIASNKLTYQLKTQKYSYKRIIIIRVMLVITLSFVLLFIGRYIAFLPVFFHEVGHILTAISFKVDISEVILSPLRGDVLINGDVPEIQYTIIAASGGLGVIIFGIVLLLLLHLNDDLALTLYAPLSSAILQVVISDLYYFFTGAITISNDMGQIILLNPNLNPLAISYWCLVGIIAIIIFWSWSIFKRARVIIDVFKSTKIDLNHELNH